jgi:hypothetical protein
VREFGAEDLANRFTTSVLGRALAADIGALEIRHRGQTGTLKKRQPRNWIAQVRILNYRQFKTIGKDVSTTLRSGFRCRCDAAPSCRRHARARPVKRSGSSFYLLRLALSQFRSLVINNLNYVCLGLFW